MKKNRRGEIICTTCRQPIELNGLDIQAIKQLGKDLAVNFFHIKYKDVDLYCKTCPPNNYEWRLRYRGVIPIQIKEVECNKCTTKTPNNERRWFRENCPHCKGTGKKCEPSS